MQPVVFHDLGIIDYKKAWEYQENLFKQILEQKLKNRATENQELRTNNQEPRTKNQELTTKNKQQTQSHLIFCEHPHVFTLGKSGSENNLLINESQLKEKQATYYKINRGGDITYHGPGQLVGYPIFDLDNFFTDIHKYLRFLEEITILTLAEYGIKGERIEGLTGVWLDAENPAKARKICALGVHASRWVTMHGFAFNINTDINYFNNIIPCGITDKAVTSLDIELNRKVEMDEVKEKMKKHFSVLFEIELV